MAPLSHTALTLQALQMPSCCKQLEMKAYFDFSTAWADLSDTELPTVLIALKWNQQT